MIIYTNQKSKKRKKLNSKQKELKESWEKMLKKYEPKTKVSTKNVNAKTLTPKSYIRETPYYPSLDTGGGSCTKPIHGKVYTGSAMKGIGTLHKSNAVPIFSEQDAVDQANMRR